MFSIIIPMYNAEKYIDVCLTSVKNQSFMDYEVIIINDGSTDNSLTICQKFANADKRIRIINKNNEGLSAARNDGVLLARFDYILFLDSDDWWIDQNVLEEINRSIETYQSDLVYFGLSKYNSEDSNGSILNNISNIKKVYFTGCDFITDILPQCPDFGWYSVCYAVKKDILLNNSIFFPIGLLYEDLLTTYKIILCSRTISVINRSIYCYRLNQASITGSKKIDNLKGHLYACKYVIDELDNTSLEKRTKELLGNNFAASFYAVLIDSNYLSIDQQKEILSLLNQYIYIIEFTKNGKQLFCKYLIKILGINNTAKILRYRSKIKK